MRKNNTLRRILKLTDNIIVRKKNRTSLNQVERRVGRKRQNSMLLKINEYILLLIF